MEMYWRFVWQQNIYWASCEPCTASVFWTQVRNGQVNWKIGTRRAIIKAVREGLPLDQWTRRSDYQQWCIEQLAKPRAGLGLFLHVQSQQLSILFLSSQSLLLLFLDFPPLPSYKETCDDI